MNWKGSMNGCLSNLKFHPDTIVPNLLRPEIPKKLVIEHN